jgi:predicted dienelactone hydrolase
MMRRWLGACAILMGACTGPARTATQTQTQTDASVAPVVVADAATPPGRAGCGGARLLPVPDDPAAPGPWPVGVRTLTLAGLRVEVWYPARPGSAVGVTPVAYDLGEELPEADAKRLHAAGVTLPEVPCACFRDLPLDEGHGPYPLVMYAHGLTLFRFASVTLTAHWASRGFVVVAADLPGAMLSDVLSGKPRRSNGAVAADAARVLDAAAKEVFPGHVDVAHVGITGHSLGGEVASRLAAERGEVIISMAERGVEAQKGRKFLTLIVGGTEDHVEPFVRQERGFASSPEPKRFAAIEGAGHLSFTDVCSVAGEQGGLYAVAHAAGVKMEGFLAGLADRGCKETKVAAGEAGAKIKAVTTEVLEEVLTCRGGAGVGAGAGR